MTELSVVRTAVPEDEEGIMALCRLLHEENGLFDLQEDRVRLMMKRAWNRDRVIIFVIGDIGLPVACMALFIGEAWYSGQVTLEELFNFVHPDHRRSAHARSLIEAAKSASDELAMPLMIGIISNERTDAKVRLYRRQLAPAGVFFIHNAHLAKGGIGAIAVG